MFHSLKKAKPSSVKVILDVPHLEKDVVQWMTTEDKLQMMFLRMTLEDVETQSTYNCKVTTTGRGNAEKSLGGEWSNFVIGCNLQESDRLIFDLEDPPTKMYVRHIRGQ